MKKVYFMLIALMSVVALTGCGVQEEKAVFKYVGLKVYDPVYIGIEAGIFDEVGIEVELIDTVAGGPTGIQLVAGGSVNGALSSYMGIINAVNAGLPIIGVTDLQSSVEGQPLEEFYVKKDSGINTLQDLKGKRIAINLVKSSFHYTWIIALESVGLTEDDVTFVVLPFGEQIAALDLGQVDAIGLMTPFNAMAQEREDFFLLTDALQIFGSKQFTLHLVNKVWAEKNPEDAKKFVEGVVKSIQFIYDNPVRAKEIIAQYTGVDVKYVADYRFQENGMVVLEDAQYWLDFMRNRNDLTISPALKVEDFATNKYNRFVK
jgi:ABC-type nitrate/sulfonate/bicarbonate transport system substrate-binding protein